MNIALLKKVDTARRGILATILKTEGHTYKKAGERALYEVDDPLPVYGNIGSGCADQEILIHGRKAFTEKKPVTVRIDTTDPSDIVFGYGSFCGGVIEVVLEPIFDCQKMAYREVREYLEKEDQPPRRDPLYLRHDLLTGEITLYHDTPRVWEDSFPRIDPNSVKSSASIETLLIREDMFIERVHPPPDLFLFGATPLAYQIIDHLREMDFRIHVADWRETYRVKFKDVDHIRLQKEFSGFDNNWMVLILSHFFERDRDVLKKALLEECTYIGLLSSKTRRDRMFEELREDGIPDSKLFRVSSPAGIDIEAKSDPEIAVSIIAELIRFKNRLL